MQPRDGGEVGPRRLLHGVLMVIVCDNNNVVGGDTDWKFTERAVGRCVMGVIGLRLRLGSGWIPEARTTPKRTGCGAGAAGANLKSAFVVGQNFALGKLLLNSMVLFLCVRL